MSARAVPAVGHRTDSSRRLFLLWQLSVREFIGPYKGTFLGAAWTIFYPFLLLFVYAFIFSAVFKMRWGIGTEQGFGSYALILFCGFIPYTFLNMAVQRSTNIILSNVSLVSKVVFPLELLPASVILAAFYNAMISTAVVLVARTLLLRAFYFDLIAFFPTLLSLVLLTTGICYFVASFSVFVRDFASVINILLQILFFMTPITYPEEAVPAKYRFILSFNPLTPIVREWRRALLTGLTPRFSSVLFSLATSALACVVGVAWFVRTRRAFVEVL